jgi:hypothetical protein
MSSLPFSPSCPAGGTWYVCGAGSKSKFVGCCSTDPCSSKSNGCPAGSLQPAAFSASAYGTFADQECSAGLFYTCTSPPFLGCCKSNPCAQGGCPRTDLASAFLSSDPGKAADFLPKSKSAGGAAPSAVGSMPMTESHASNGMSTGAIVGIAIAAVAIIAGLTGAFIYVFVKRRRAREEAEGTRYFVAKQSFDSTASTPQMTIAPYPRGTRAKQYSPYRGMSRIEPTLCVPELTLSLDTFANSAPSSSYRCYYDPQSPPPSAAHHKHSHTPSNDPRYPPRQTEATELSASNYPPVELYAGPDRNSHADHEIKYDPPRFDSPF